MQRKEAIAAVKKWLDDEQMYQCHIDNNQCEFQYSAMFPDTFTPTAKPLSIAMPLNKDVVDIIKDIRIAIENEALVAALSTPAKRDFIFGLRFLLIGYCDFDMKIEHDYKTFSIRLYRRIYIEDMNKTDFMREIELLNRVYRMVYWYFAQQSDSVRELQEEYMPPMADTRDMGIFKRRGTKE